MQIGVTYAPWPVVEGSPVADSADLDAGGIYVDFVMRADTAGLDYTMPVDQ